MDAQGQTHLGEKRLRARSIQFPTVRAMIAEDPMGAGGRLAESCASVLPYALGRLALLFLEAGRRRAQRSATLERSFQECTLTQVLDKKQAKSLQEVRGKKWGLTGSGRETT